MQKYEKSLTIALIISYLLIMFLISNIEYRNQKILDQENKIIDLQIELDSEKEKSHQLELEQKRSVLDEQYRRKHNE